MPKVRFERDGDVGIVTLADPPLNLFGRDLIADLYGALDEAAETDVRALVVRAEGEVFTGGADVNMFVGLTGEQVERELDLVAMPRKLEALPIPTLAVVRGLCLTAGFELSLGCDLFWAAESAKFGLVEQSSASRPSRAGRSGWPSAPARRARASS